MDHRNYKNHPLTPPPGNLSVIPNQPRTTKTLLTPLLAAAIIQKLYFEAPNCQRNKFKEFKIDVTASLLIALRPSLYHIIK